MIFGQTYFSVQEDNGLSVVRRHYWDNHEFDFKCEKHGNCYLDKGIAQRVADDQNSNPKTLYKHCNYCKMNTRNKKGICSDCGTNY